MAAPAGKQDGGRRPPVERRLSWTTLRKEEEAVAEPDSPVIAPRVVKKRRDTWLQVPREMLPTEDEAAAAGHGTAAPKRRSLDKIDLQALLAVRAQTGTAPRNRCLSDPAVGQRRSSSSSSPPPLRFSETPSQRTSVGGESGIMDDGQSPGQARRRASVAAVLADAVDIVRKTPRASSPEVDPNAPRRMSFADWFFSGNTRVKRSDDENGDSEDNSASLHWLGLVVMAHESPTKVLNR